MRSTPLLAVFLLVAGTAAADTGQVVPAPAWQYQFPPALWVTVSQPSRGDLRYLAATTTRWRYHPSDKPGEVTVEGENAVYFFDLVEKRLLWKEAFAEGTAAFVEGLSAGGEFVAVQVGGSDSGRISGYRGGRSVEGIADTGTREPGVRLYDRRGRLLARNAPVGMAAGALVVRPLESGERPLSGELTKALAVAGVQSVPVVGRNQGFTWTAREGRPVLAYFDLDGTARWEYELPPLRPLPGSGWATVGRSPDGAYALYSVIPADVPDPNGTRRVLLFGCGDGLIWAKDLSMHLEGETVPTPYSVRLLLAAGAASAVIQRGPAPSMVQVLDRQGQEKSAVAFGGIIPVALSVSASGRYWAAALRRWTQEPGLDDKGWTEGIHVFDGDTGKVVWRSPAMAGALAIDVSDGGGVIAFSAEDRALVVFEPPHERVAERGQPPDSGEARHCEGRPQRRAPAPGGQGSKGNPGTVPVRPRPFPETRDPRPGCLASSTLRPHCAIICNE
jgi:hypothetical protein